MPKAPNTHGGGALTNAHGLHFEQTTSLCEALLNEGYSVSSDGKVCNSKGDLLGYSKSKKSFIKYLEKSGVDISVNSYFLLPDDAFINIRNKTVYIIEKKFQNTSCSIDEKLQTCLYKKRQYSKLASQINYDIEYIYILNDWFKKKKYKDVREYILDVGCLYFFNELPLDVLDIT